MTALTVDRHPSESGVELGFRTEFGVYPDDEATQAMTTTDRIELNPRVMLGKPVIRGTRIPVELILRKLSEGASEVDVLDAYPHLTREDIQAAMRFRESMEDFKSGRYSGPFDTAEEATASLHKAARASRARKSPDSTGVNDLAANAATRSLAAPPKSARQS